MKKLKTIQRILRKLVMFAIILSVIMAVFFFYSNAVTKNQDSFVYALPFESGTKHRVVQGYGGLFSHSHIAAIDFEMPVGTPVCVARSGTIYSYKDDSNEGGFFSGNKYKANYIIIQHEDGSFSCYWHLKQNGVLIKSGHVMEGQVISYSGATGQVIRPHLHFSVKSKLSYEMDAYRRTQFRTSDGNSFLMNGSSYSKPD